MSDNSEKIMTEEEVEPTPTPPPTPDDDVEQYNWFTRPESKKMYEDLLRKYATQTTPDQVDIFDKGSREYWDEFKSTIEKNPNVNWMEVFTYPDLAMDFYQAVYFRQELSDFWEEMCRDGAQFLFQCKDHYGRYLKKILTPESGKGVSFNLKNHCRVIGKKFVSMGSGKRVKIGRGLELKKDSDPKYRYFGKYVLHIPSLEKNILNVKYNSLTNVQMFPRRKISTQFRDFIINILDTEQMDHNVFKQLTENESNLFHELCRYAGVCNMLGLGLPPVVKDKDMDRFDLIKGEIIAGNNSPQLLRELKRYILQFLAENKMNKKEAYQLLGEISILDV